MSHTRFKGRTAAEAAIRACEQLGTTRSELRYDIVEDEGEGLSRTVTIEVTSNTPAPQQQQQRQPEPSPEPAFVRPVHEGLAGDYDDDDEPPRRDEVPNEAPRSGGGRRGGQRAPRERDQRGDQGQRDRGPRQRDESQSSGGGASRSGGRRRGRSSTSNRQGSERPERSQAPERQEASERPRNERRREPGPRRGQGPGLDTLLELREAPPAPAPLPAIDSQSARSQAAVAVVSALTKHMDLSVDVSLVREEESEIHVHITGTDEKKAIGQRGEVLLSLQFLANRLLGRAEHEDEADQVLVLDAGGHRQRRHAAIESLAKALAERAVAENKAVRLSPMSAHDRRIFHVALKEMEQVVTQSEGDGLLRNLLIVPSVFVR